MSENISDSRFNMWRAVMALILADDVIQPEEIEFMNNYLEKVPFNDHQRVTIRSDLSEKQNVGELYENITEAEDRGQFFMFARMLVWCDGDLDAQEEKIFNDIMQKHMKNIDSAQLRQDLVLTRDDLRLKTAIENEAFKKEAQDTVGLSAIFKAWLGV